MHINDNWGHLKTSLYPAIQYKLRLPIELHPEIVDGHMFPEQGFNLNVSYVRERSLALWSVRILPNRKDMIPIIPTRVNKKVMFANCKTCAESKNKEWCCHNLIRDRSFTVTTTSRELEQFLMDGGRILKTYQV